MEKEAFKTLEEGPYVPSIDQLQVDSRRRLMEFFQGLEGFFLHSNTRKESQVKRGIFKFKEMKVGGEMKKEPPWVKGHGSSSFQPSNFGATIL